MDRRAFFSGGQKGREGAFAPFATPSYATAVNIIISHIFPESFMEIPQVVQKRWRIFSVNIS